MPRVRKEIFDEVLSFLRQRQQEVTRQVNQNRFELNRLAKSQRELKAKRSELHRIVEEYRKSQPKS